MLYNLCHICLDYRVLADADVVNTIQNAIEAICCNFADSHSLTFGVGGPSTSQKPIHILISSQLSNVVRALLFRITHPILQKHLIRTLPIKSPLTAYFQRYLALSFLLHPAVIDIPLTNPEVPALIHKHLDESPTFQINKETNYSHLAARLMLLDVAIGPGLLSVPFQPLVSPALSPVGSSPVTAPFPISSEVKVFNKEIDALAQHVKLLGNSIVEAGAVVDLTILDAKDCIERLCSRLEHAVRIGGRKIHDVFGNSGGDKQSRVSKFFLKSKKMPATPSIGCGIFDEDEDDTGREVLKASDT